MVNDTFASLQPRVNSYSVQMWHLPSFPQIYCSGFPFLLYISEEQGFANPLARRIKTGRFQCVVVDI